MAKASTMTQDASTRDRSIRTPLILLFPVVALVTVTIAGYLYFSQQQIRYELRDDQFRAATQLASAWRREQARIQTDLFLLWLSVNDLRTADSDADQSAIGAVLGEFLAARQDLAGLALLNAERGELLVLGRDGNPELLPVGRASGNATVEELLTLREALLGRPLGSRFQQLSIGSAQPPAPVLTSLLSLPVANSPALFTFIRPESLLESLPVPMLGAAHYGLLGTDGRLVAHDNSSAGWQLARGNGAGQSVMPVAAINAADSNSLDLPEGVLGLSRACASLACSGEVGDSFFVLAAFVPATALSPFGLLASAPGRWLPMLSLLAVVGLISIVGAWFLGATITALRDKERRLRQATMLQDAFFERNPEIMFVKNLDGSYSLANQMCRKLAGLPDTDFTGKSNIDVFPEEASIAMEQQDSQVIQNQEAMEFHTQWGRGERITYYKTLRFPMYDDNNRMIAVGGIANDITDQVTSRHALLENEQLLRTFIESAPDAVLISDMEGQVTLVNRQAELIFDYEREEMLNQSLFDLITGLNKQRIKEAFDNAVGGGTEVFREAMESTGRGSNNRQFPVEFSLAPVITKEGALAICLLRDTSEKALMETQLRQSQKMEAVGKLTGGMAHDFNNLLGIIIGNIALALRQVPDDERLHKRLNTAMKAADRGAELTKRMLAIARRQPLQPKPVAINAVIEELALMLPQTLGSDIEMELQLTPNLPLILVDESGFEGMLLNLAINSRDAMPDGGKFSIRTYLKDRRALEQVLPQTRIQDHEFVHIMVKDCGAGMSEEALNRAFEPFFTTKEKGKGTGLGLAMIYGFVKQSRGFVFIDSKQGKGTTIHIYLPISKDTDLVAEEFSGDSDQALEGQGRTVLLVDDEEELVQIAESFLEVLGFTVLTATSGQQALKQHAAADRVDLLLTDVVMPGGMNGVALARALRERQPDLPVLYVSGFPSGVIEENSGTTLDAPLLHKPYSLAALTRAIAEILPAVASRSV
ncbi:MAG: hypothetical protein PsegKO_19090 [Pseudohongiellaceae bacterium]